eukprot:974296-Amphidinium_carterae.1
MQLLGVKAWCHEHARLVASIALANITKLLYLDGQICRGIGQATQCTSLRQSRGEATCEPAYDRSKTNLPQLPTCDSILAVCPWL